MSKLFFKIKLSLSAILFLLSCQIKPKIWTPQDLVISDQTDLNFARDLSAKQMAEDIDYLIFSLTRGYGGHDFAPNDSFSQSISALKNISKSANMAEFHNQIDDSLFIIPDNHLAAYFLGNVGKKRRIQKQQSVGRVGPNNIRDPRKIWETRIDSIGQKRILYISITKFPDSEDGIWTGFISSVSFLKKNADAIVLDLRGNTGGDDSMGMELATELYGRAFEHPIKNQFRNQSPEALALSVTDIQVQIINMNKMKEQIPPYLRKKLEEFNEKYNLSLRGQLPLNYIRTGKGGGSRFDRITGFKKPIYILMDRECGSSCEFTIAAFEWNKYVKRVGENTNGTFHFSNAGMAILPHSKIKVVIPTQYSEYYDRRFIERIGIHPDIKVEGGEDAYEVVKKNLNCL